MITSEEYIGAYSKYVRGGGNISDLGYSARFVVYGKSGGIMSGSEFLEIRFAYSQLGVRIM